MKNKIFVLLLFLLLFFPLASSAHYIVGNVNDANDGFFANNLDVMLYKYLNGESDNTIDAIGPNGNSGVDNLYLIDCEALDSPCAINDILTIKLVNTGNGRIAGEVNVTVTSSGFDLAPNLTVNTPPIFESIIVDDSNNLTINEIDLFTNNTVLVSCESVVKEYDNDSLFAAYAELYSTVSSNFGNSDDNNAHYTNSSCYTNSSYGDSNQSKITCSFNVLYYARSGNWNCEMNVNDSISIGSGIDSTTVNPLLSVGVVSNLTFIDTGADEVSGESEIIVYNFGNMEIDLNLHGYGTTPGDDLAMNCTQSPVNIPVAFKKYSFSSVLGDLTLPQFESNYINLSGLAFTENFNLAARQNDLLNNAFNSTFWRIYVPSGISGSCSGNIVFGAVAS